MVSVSCVSFLFAGGGGVCSLLLFLLICFFFGGGGGGGGELLRRVSFFLSFLMFSFWGGVGWGEGSCLVHQGVEANLVSKNGVGFSKGSNCLKGTWINPERLVRKKLKSGCINHPTHTCNDCLLMRPRCNSSEPIELSHGAVSSHMLAHDAFEPAMPRGMNTSHS